MSQLLACVCYEWGNEIHKDFLFCKELRTTTTAKDVFEALDDFMKSNGINWTNCIGVCTDRAAAMVGKQQIVVCKQRQTMNSCLPTVAPRVISTHCYLHRDALAAKDMEHGLKFRYRC